MNVMDRLFGRSKPRTSSAIAATLDDARKALASAQALAKAAAERRKAAIASGDRAGAIAAEAEQSAAGIDAEIATGEIAGLEKGLAEAVNAEQAAAKAAALAILVERRRVLARRFDGDWKRAAAVLAEIISEAKTLQRDCAEGGFDRGIERLPEIGRFDACADSASIISTWLGCALSAPPTVPESPAEAAAREHQARREREKVEAAEARRLRTEAEREDGRKAREAEDAESRRRERYPFYGMALEVPDVPGVSDAAR